MTKQEFLDALKRALSDTVTPEVMMDTYRYYANYIEEQMQKGKSEHEVLEELGKPDLIARSVIAAQKGERFADEEYTEDGRTRRFDRKVDFTEKKEKGEKVRREFRFDFRSWYARLLFAFLVLLFIGVVFVIIKGLFIIFIQFGIPLLLILGIIYLILYFMR